MAEQSPPVIAPTVIISNSESETNENGSETHSSNEAHSDGNENLSGSSLELDTQSPNTENVAIAAIEAERDVTLAAIHSDIERERIELEGERIEAIAERNEELEECRNQIATLTERVEALTLLIQPPVLVEEIQEELPIAQEPDLIHPSTQAPIVETPMENLEENVEESLEPITSRVRRFIPI